MPAREPAIDCDGQLHAQLKAGMWGHTGGLVALEARCISGDTQASSLKGAGQDPYMCGPSWEEFLAWHTRYTHVTHRKRRTDTRRAQNRDPEANWVSFESSQALCSPKHVQDFQWLCACSTRIRPLNCHLEQLLRDTIHGLVCAGKRGEGAFIWGTKHFGRAPGPPGTHSHPTRTC
mmetsp:Transcript_2986/g.5255  ORF Transcript_2986/g.5255 Transcript_2986/m.5255 type:complete len:176 (-) Transcript_2986:278-805(-)